jgi:hypothetical protein
MLTCAALEDAALTCRGIVTREPQPTSGEALPFIVRVGLGGALETRLIT